MWMFIWNPKPSLLAPMKNSTGLCLPSKVHRLGGCLSTKKPLNRHRLRPTSSKASTRLESSGRRSTDLIIDFRHILSSNHHIEYLAIMRESLCGCPKILWFWSSSTARLGQRWCLESPKRSCERLKRGSQRQFELITECCHCDWDIHSL